MSFNIFDYPRRSDITVGYVDPVLGYVTGVSICEANDYAKLNPGTTFIFETRDEIRYLNINEVNNLTPNDLASSADTCTGVQVESQPGYPESIFSGGGGVGASGNPVFGRDGSLLAVDLISGGFGYQYPPLVEVRDETGLGVGAVTRAVLVGDPDYPDCKYVDTEEVFDQESDFEDYQICDPVDDEDYGIRYDSEGRPIGKWDPKLYATLSQDPISREIRDYQDFLKRLQTPWWTTRKENPLKVISQSRPENRIKHDVQHPGWGGEYGSSESSATRFRDVTFTVFTSGGKGKGLAIKFKSEDGSHTFSIKADDYKGNERGQKVTVPLKVNTIYNVSSQGSFRGKGTEIGLAGDLEKNASEVNTRSSTKPVRGKVVFADFLESSNDNDDLQLESNFGEFSAIRIGLGDGSRSTYNVKYEFRDSSAFDVSSTSRTVDESFMNKYAVSPVPPSNVPGSDFAGQEFTMEWEEDFPFDGEYTFRGMADNLGRFYLDNEKLFESVEFRKDRTPATLKKTIKAGPHRIRVDLYNKPIKEKIIVQQPVKPPAPDPTQQPFKIKTSYDGVRNLPYNFKAGIYKIYAEYKQDVGPTGLAIEIKNKANGRVVFNSLQSINGANIKLTPVTLGGIDLKEFTKNSQESKDFLKRSGVFPENVKNNSITNIEWNNVQLNEDGDYQISVCVDDSVDITISLVDSLPNAVQVAPPPAQKSQSSTQTDLDTKVRRVFNTVDYIDKADRKLWRLDPRAGRDSGFINQYGILPFDPNSNQAQSESFSGTHVIRWEYVDFPVDGNYNIEIMVDDDVTLYIGNRDGGGRVEIGNGLRSIDQGGDEVIIRKEGFSSPGRSTGKSLETKFFKAGRYRIRAELEQIKGRPLSQGNPMALAINIETSFVEDEVISKKSWNENPMGAALTIDAPLPPIPQEPIPPQEGRCPNNPIWTTRFPTGKQKWWPVNFTNPDPNAASWSRFMNRYAISPIPPLSKPGSDGGGIVYRNEWEVDIPYDGFYAFKSTVDNAGRILVDNQPIMQANYIPVDLRNTRGGSGAERRSGISDIDGGIIFNWRENNPKSKKVFLSKGRHTIQIEVENGITETFTKIDKKIFSTSDWKAPTKRGPSSVDVTFNVSSFADFSNSISIPELDINFSKTYKGPQIKEKTTKSVEVGKVYSIELKSPESKSGVRLRSKGSILEMEEAQDNDWSDIVCAVTKGRFFDFKNGSNRATCKFVVDPEQDPGLSAGTTKDGIVFEGPTPIANYSGDFISPVFQNVNANPNEEIQGRSWVFRWSNVDFPVDGQYTLETEADDELIVRVNGVDVGRAEVFKGRNKTIFNATRGKKTVELELSNIRIRDTGFQQNPVVGFAKITVPVDVSTGISKSWAQNPIGISAILIPPPCPKKVTGKGVVCRVIVDDPGNGYPAPFGDGYPATLRLRTVEVESPGINYNCGVDQIQISPNNGAELSYECDTFGRITKVNVLNPGLGFTQTPEISILTDTGVNAVFRPQFEVVRDPIVVDPEILIQVTDLVGLKQTGYVDGRPYYGAVFYKDGIRYAGFYQTPGQLVQVYNTLQESIDATVTTPPSAILRQGTDISSNDPRLNIPGTPDQII
jgi:hypothetical protein